MGAVRKSRSQIYELMRLLCLARLLKPASRYAERLVGDWLYGYHPITTTTTTTATSIAAVSNHVARRIHKVSPTTTQGLTVED